MRAGKARGWLLACVLATACQRVARPEPPVRGAPRPVRILPLGDSITQGRGTLGGQRMPTQSWRYPFWQELVRRGACFDLIGGSRSGFEDDPIWPAQNGEPFDADHESRWGWRLDEVLALLRIDSPSLRPDAALVLLGGNDLGQGETMDSLWPEWQELIALLRSMNPSVVIVVGTYCGDWQPNASYRAELIRRVPGWNTPASPVALADACTGFVPDPARSDTDTVDWVHPNASGDAKIAAAFLAALERLMPQLAERPAAEPCAVTARK